MAFVLVLSSTDARAQEEKLEPGLTLTFESSGATDARTARLAALHVPEKAAPTPFLPPGAFKATWAGNLNTRIRETVTFSAAGRGTLKVLVADQIVLETSGDDLSAKAGTPVQLKKGKNPIRVEYAAPAAGPAEVRLFWQGANFAAEPVPPTAFTHDVADKAFADRATLRDGRTLFADLRCAKCHAPAEKFQAGSMPELAMDAPSLTDVGARLNEGFVAAWIADPKSLRPQATMPKVLHGAEAAAQSKDIAAYLATLGTKSTQSPAADDAAVTAGARHFTSMGCVACHTAPDSNKSDAARIPLSIVKSKWQPAALVAYLLKPEHTYEWTPMPNFHLSDAEAGQLAAYLIAKSPAKEFPGGGDVAKGKALLATAGCLNCHTAPDATAHKAPTLADIAKSGSNGCLASDDASRGKAPDFSLASQHQAALQSFLSTGLDSLNRDNPVEFAQRQFVLSNCSACHLRDNLGDTWSDLKEEVTAIESALPAPAEDHGEKYAPDQSRPILTWLGEKLKPEWTASFVSGKVPYKPRPYIQARMPGFASRAHLMAEGFAHEHGYPAKTPADVASDPALAAIGQKLAGKTGGFSCNNCHAIGDAPATAAFEAPAANFAHVAERLRHDYYVRWVRNPQRVERGTRMPTFANDEGKTPVKDILDGDASKQFDAIWHYILQGPKIAPPPQ